MQVLDDVPEDVLNAAYGRGYYEGANIHVYKNYLANSTTLRKAYGEKFDRLVGTHARSPGSCLEIGCAFGLLLAEARDRGWTVRGVERSEHAAEWARRELQLHVDTSPDAMSAIPSASQDVVMLWDVMEHLKHPVGMLQEIRRVLRDGGVLALVTTDISSIGARLYGRRWHLIAPPYHLCYFDRASMKRMLAKTGFRVHSMQSEDHPLRNPRFKILNWIATHDRVIGWRLDSGPAIHVEAIAS